MKNEIKYKVKLMINKYGLKETLRLFDDNVDIIRRAYRDNPSEFLNQFNDLSPVEKNNVIYYLDKDRLPLFMHFQDEKNNNVYINYYRIWVFFSEIIGMEYKEIKGIIKNWLEETYNLSGLTPFHCIQFR